MHSGARRPWPLSYRLLAQGSVPSERLPALRRRRRRPPIERNRRPCCLRTRQARRSGGGGAAAQASRAGRTAKTILAASNVDLGSGSPLAILGDTAQLGELDAQTIKDNAKREANYHTGNSQLAGMEAKSASTAGVIGAFSTVLGGASSLADKWYKPAFGASGQMGLPDAVAAIRSGGTQRTQAQQANNASPDAFGGSAARALTQAGQQAQGLGGELMRLEKIEKDRDDAATVLDATAEASNRMRKSLYGEGGLFTRTGGNADGVTDLALETADTIGRDVAKALQDAGTAGRLQQNVDGAVTVRRQLGRVI